MAPRRTRSGKYSHGWTLLLENVSERTYTSSAIKVSATYTPAPSSSSSSTSGPRSFSFVQSVTDQVSTLQATGLAASPAFHQIYGNWQVAISDLEGSLSSTADEAVLRREVSPCLTLLVPPPY